MALEAGNLVARLGAAFEKTGFEQWDAAFGKTREQSKVPVLGKLGVHVDSEGFTRFNREMRQAATEKAMGRITVDERPAQAKLNILSKQVITVKAEIAKGKEMGLETGVARAQLRLLQGETRATEKEIARSRLGLDQQTKALGMEAAASRVGAAAAAEHTTRLGRFTSGLTAAGKSLDAHGKGLRSYGHEISGLSLPIAAAGAGAIKLGMDFQASMERVHGQAGATEGEVRKMSKAILDMAPHTAHAPKELADALFHVESTGIRGAKALDVLKYAAIGANVGNAKLTDVTNALVGVLKTAPHDIHSAGQAMGLLNAVVGAGNMKMQDLVGAMSTGVLPAAKSFGLGVRDVGASLDVMTARGIPAEQAATRLRMTFSLMAAPTSKAIKALQTIGLSQSQLSMDMRQPNGVLVAMQDLKRHLESSGKSAIEQNQVIQHAFGGGRTSSGVLTLVQNTKDLGKAYHDLPTQTAPALKKLEDANAQWEKTSKAHWDNARAAMETSAVRIGTQLAPIILPVLVKIAHAVERAVSWFSKLPGPVKSGAVAAIGLTAVLGPLLILFGSLTVAVGRTVGAVKGLATAWRWVTGASKDAGAAQVVAGTEGEAAAVKAEAGGLRGLLGKGGRLVGRLGIGAGVGMAGMMGAQALGGAVGGGTGSAISGIGGKAALGAGLGMLSAPKGRSRAASSAAWSAASSGSTRTARLRSTASGTPTLSTPGCARPVCTFRHWTSTPPRGKPPGR